MKALPSNNTLHYDLKKQTLSEGFSFHLYLLKDEVEFSLKLRKYLGFEQAIRYIDFVAMIPKEEKKTVLRVHRLMGKFRETHPNLSRSSRILLLHSLINNQKKKVRILREITMLPDRHTVCTNRCIDLTNLNLGTGVQFDLNFMPPIPTKSIHKRALAFFDPIHQNSERCFSSRQLEVLKVWSEYDSASIVAEQLNITIRTLETHLKNMRERIGARRTMDVLLFAKDRGWV